MARRFKKDELDNIINDYNNGLRPYELAIKYNRTSTTIIQKLKQLNIYHDLNYRFTNDDIIFLKEYYPSGNWEIIMKRFPTLNKQSIESKASSLGIKQINNNLWTDDEIEILMKYYSQGVDCVKLYLPNRTYDAICTKAERLGLKTREFWSDKEKELLKNIYHLYPIEEVLKYFPNRNKNSIIHQAMKLDLQSYDYNPWEKYEDDYIIKNYKNKPDLIIGEELHRTQRAVRARRLYLGLHRREMSSLTYESLSKYIRGNIQQWKNDSMKNCNFQCVLTGSKDFHIHHLYSVSSMINNIMKNNNFKYYKNINDYTDNELKEILNAFINEQSNYPFGVCVRKDIHKFFHKLYGQYNNTPEQWEQFVNDYKTGIYNNQFN